MERHIGALILFFWSPVFSLLHRLALDMSLSAAAGLPLVKTILTLSDCAYRHCAVLTSRCKSLWDNDSTADGRITAWPVIWNERLRSMQKAIPQSRSIKTPGLLSCLSPCKDPDAYLRQLGSGLTSTWAGLASAAHGQGVLQASAGSASLFCCAFACRVFASGAPARPAIPATPYQRSWSCALSMLDWINNAAISDGAIPADADL